ncbi:uncharacterized protein CC84DRAFT_175002 [Paraphaeosphaeria sporulosa]|uniref:Uncharacterized protein n=1 Tax=Paraphaeosphaeria sporulosa TaxID=1460663 RepID=A0A177D1U4_9PLEO|nr:uncharacterized protein CC84DRAFT_175002 [Paraphaeosphaeria sporulosa]OAG13009.1 hypothetical protein CC84DRAFT_175002 [Paraphaeosphaeria sporulosa]
MGMRWRKKRLPAVVAITPLRERQATARRQFLRLGISSFHLGILARGLSSPGWWRRKRSPSWQPDIAFAQVARAPSSSVDHRGRVRAPAGKHSEIGSLDDKRGAVAALSVIFACNSGSVSSDG